MKICIVSQTFAPQEEGGAEISARLGALQLAKYHDVTVLALGKEGDPLAPPGETRLAGNIRVFRIPWQNTYLPGPRKPSANVVRRAQWHIKTAFGAVCTEKLTAFFLTEKFDLVYAQNCAFMQPALFQAAERAGVPVCLHLRDYALLCPKTSMYRRGDNCARPCVDCSILSKRMRNSGAGLTVIAVSDALKARFLDNGVLADAEWHVMHNTNTHLDHFDKNLLRRKKPANDKFTFAYLGALSEEKGIRDLVAAFASLSLRKTAKLVVAGRGSPAEESLLRHLAGDADVEFKGHMPPQTIYAIADAIVVPSRWHEPQSRVLIEAAMHGIPVIGTRRGGTPEILEAHSTGWCYDPDAPTELRDLLAKALDIGQRAWWEQRATLFPGIDSFKGAAEESKYYSALEDILVSAAKKQPVDFVA